MYGNIQDLKCRSLSRKGTLEFNSESLNSYKVEKY